jgi:cell division protein FtsB
MRYWGGESKVTRSSRNARGTRARAPRKSSRAGSVASGGSVKPFLRRFYNHQAVVSGPVQRIVLFLLLAGLLYAFVLGDGGAIRIAILRHQRAELDRDIAQLQHNASLLEREIDRLQNDPFYIEKIGRERYGYVKKDEQVIKIVPKPSEKQD